MQKILAKFLLIFANFVIFAIFVKAITATVLRYLGKETVAVKPAFPSKLYCDRFQVRVFKSQSHVTILKAGKWSHGSGILGLVKNPRAVLTF